MKKILFASAVLFALAAEANATETTVYEVPTQMTWTLKNNSKLSCRLSAGATLRTKGDLVEMKKLVCTKSGDFVLVASVSCGPEGSVTRFDNKKITVICK